MALLSGSSASSLRGRWFSKVRSFRQARWWLACRALFDVALERPGVLIPALRYLDAHSARLADLESAADLYCSYFVVPPAADCLPALSRIVWVGDRPLVPEHVITYWLSPYFPCMDVFDGSWGAHGKLQSRTFERVARWAAGHTAPDLYTRYLYALFHRVDEADSTAADWDRSDEARGLLDLLLPAEGIPPPDAGTPPHGAAKGRGEGSRQGGSTAELLASLECLVDCVLGPFGGGVESHLADAFPETGSPMTVLVPLRTTPAAANSLVPLPGMPPSPASLSTWQRRLPGHSFVIARPTTSVLRLARQDASEVPALVLRPAGWSIRRRANGDWHAVGVRYRDGSETQLADSPAGTLAEWAAYASQKCLGVDTTHRNSGTNECPSS